MVCAAAMAAKSTEGGEGVREAMHDNMAKIANKLGDEIEVANFSGRVTVGGIVQGVRERFVVCQNEDRTTFKEMSEVSNGNVHSEKFTPKSAVPSLRRLKWLPRVVDSFVKSGADCYVQSFNHDTKWCVWLRMAQ